MSFFDTNIFTFVVLPATIFMLRICDVTIGTMRIIFVTRGNKFLAPLTGFFEVLIWLIAISKVMHSMNNAACFIAYAGGFAAGNYVGMIIEEKLAIGAAIIRIITQEDASELIQNLKNTGYGVTTIPAQGGSGLVHIIFSVIKRSDLDNILGLINKFNPKAFYSVEDVRLVNEGVFPRRRKAFANAHRVS